LNPSSLCWENPWESHNQESAFSSREGRSWGATGRHDARDLGGFSKPKSIAIIGVSRGALFRVAPPLELKKLEAIFRHKVFRMLLAKGKITQEMIAMLSKWRHSGFHVFCGNYIISVDNH
jgi:hypothetical protein